MRRLELSTTKINPNDEESRLQMSLENKVGERILIEQCAREVDMEDASTSRLTSIAY